MGLFWASLGWTGQFLVKQGYFCLNKSGPYSKLKSCPHAYVWTSLIFLILEGGSPFFLNEWLEG